MIESSHELRGFIRMIRIYSFVMIDNIRAIRGREILARGGAHLLSDSNQNPTPADAGKPSHRRMTVIVLSIVVLLLMLSLIAQSGFNLRPFVTPDTAAETLLLYALSTLNFLAFVTSFSSC